MAFSLLSMSGLLLLGFIFIFSVIVQSVYKAYTAPLRKIPGPLLARFTRFWLFKAIGSRDFQHTNIKLHQKYGSIVRIAPNEYSIDDFEAAQVLYRPRDQLEKAPRYSAWGLPTGEPNLFTYLDVQRHAERRRQINSIYSTSALMNIEYQVDGPLKTFLQKIDGFANTSTTIDMAEWFQLYAFDTIGALTFGKPFGFLEKGSDIADIMATIHTYSRYGAVMGAFPEWHATIFGLLQMVAPKGNVGIAYVHKFAADMMIEHGKKPQEIDDILDEKTAIGIDEESGILKKDYLSTLYARHRKDPEAFNEDSIYYHILSNVIAGAETTGIALSAVFHYLGRSPSALKNLRAELDDFIQKRKANGPISMKESLEMPYLQAVIKETLRLFPSAGLPMPRVIPKGGLTLADQFFPEGALVGINSWVAHANRSVFGDDADDFRPERWLADQATRNRMEQYFFTVNPPFHIPAKHLADRKLCHWVESFVCSGFDLFAFCFANFFCSEPQFGRGPRTCSGKAISMMELSKAVPELVLRYDITLADPEHEWTVHNDWFVKQEDYMCKVSARK